MRNYVVVKGNKLNAQVMPFVKGARLGDVFSISLYLECPDKAHIVKNVGFFLSIANDDR